MTSKEAPERGALVSISATLAFPLATLFGVNIITVWFKALKSSYLNDFLKEVTP